MEGITILNENVVYSCHIGVTIILVSFCIIGMIIGIIVNTRNSYNKFIDGLAGMLFGLLVGLACGLLTGMPLSSIWVSDEVNHIEYKVTIDDSVSFNEFNDTYKIISQDGKIFTIQERN